MRISDWSSDVCSSGLPVGAVVVSPERGVIGRAHNQREQLHDPTAHAEMIAITQAAQARRSWRLDGCLLYVTLEPCPMCAGAIVLARLALLAIGRASWRERVCKDVSFWVSAES